MAQMMEAVRTFETSVYINDTTRRQIPEGYYLISFSWICVNHGARGEMSFPENICSPSWPQPITLAMDVLCKQFDGSWAYY
jgi:hypothetical protein